MRGLRATIPALLALLLPAGASAAQLSMVEAGGPEFPDRSYVLQVDPPVALDERAVGVRENGEPVQGLEVSSASDSGAGEFGSVLVIDASLSVKGEAIAAAMKAARAFAAHRASGQQLGVIAFNSGHDAVLPLTTDESAIEKALSRPPRLAAGTHLYDAVAAAVSLLGDGGVDAGSVVVLSDGADTGSEASEEAVVREAAVTGVRIFVVGLESGHFDPGQLSGLTRAGEYATATDPRNLEPIFSRFGAQRASEHLIRYRSSAAAGERVTVEARVDGVPGRARTSYEAPGGGPPVAVESADASGFWGSTKAMVGVALLIALLIGAAVLAAIGPRRESVVERLARFGVIGGDPGPEQALPARRDAGARAGGPLAAIERPLEGRDWWQRFEESLDVAEIEVSAIKIVVATVVATLLAIVLIAVLAPFPLLAFLALLIPVAVRAVIDRKLRAVRERFAEDLADNLQVVASAIRVGHSMVGALAVLVEEATGPARDEFRRIVAAERVGVPLEDSIREVARRMASRDMEQLALVAIIQRETGGNTAEIIDRAVETIRERAELRRMMSSLTAQGRLSRGIVTALPLVLLAAISLINPSYMAPLFNTSGGQIMLLIGGTLVLVGSLAIKRIVDVRV